MKKKKKKFKKNSAILRFEPRHPTTKSSPLTTTLSIESFECCFITVLILCVIINTPAPPVFNNELI